MNSLREEANRLLSEGMSNIYFKATIERKTNILKTLTQCALPQYFRGSCLMRRDIFLWGRSVHFKKFFQFIHILKYKIYFQKFKTLACSTLIFNIHISRFKIHAELQVDIDFDTESKLSCSRSSFFSPLSGHSKPTKPMKLFSFLSSVFRGPSKLSRQ